jgi:hypothetical protein
MASERVSEKNMTNVVFKGNRWSQALMLTVMFGAMAFLAVYLQQPPPAAPADVPLTDFSSARALRHVQAIAQKPRPIGSEQHAAARDYIIGELRALGIDPQLHVATSVNPDWGMPYRVATVRNIVARIGGGSEKHILLTAHYDSAPTGPGASDDGVGVATLLETARALKSGPPLRNDVVFLFTDGEESGLMGAKAFVGEHQWAKNAGIVLSFEARGSRGPVIMFETSDQNGQLIEEFAAAAPDPITNSLFYEIYKRLPNDTDLTIFKKAGATGLNFAYIEGITHYHTEDDSLNHLSERSLQHHGNYAMALARHFGGLDLTVAKKRNAVYFNLLGPTLAHYSGALVIPLAALSLLLYICLVIAGLTRRELTAKGLAFGALTLLVSGVVVWMTVSLIMWLVRSLHKGYESAPWRVPYNSGLYELALVLLTISVTAVVYGQFRRKLSMADLWVGVQFWWVSLAVAVSILVPGGSFLLVWPLLFALAATKLSFASKGEWDTRQIVALAICAIPAVLLFSPMIYNIFAAMTLNAAGGIAILLVLLCSLLAPYLESLTRSHKWAFPGGMALLSVILILVGLLAAGFGNNQPKINHVFYYLNADTGQAMWGSADKAPDEWTAQFFPEGGERMTMTEFFPITSRTFLTSTAPSAPLPAPEVMLLNDGRNTPARDMRLRIKSSRKAPILSIYVKVGGELLTASVNGREVPTETGNGEWWGLRYYALPEQGVELSLQMKASGPVEVRVDDCSYSLPADTPVKKRPAYMMASPSFNSDVTLVGKSFKF